MWVIAAAMLVLGSTDPDEPISTAPAQSLGSELMRTLPSDAIEAPPQVSAPDHGLTTNQQIERWLASRSRDHPTGDPFATEATEARGVHGEVWAGLGSHGYRDHGVTVVAPLGERGELGFSYRRTKNSYVADPYRYRVINADPVFPSARDSRWVGAPGWSSPSTGISDPRWPVGPQD